ncbi:hypothetical protein NLI96_g11187 [Meripilus lineatus]|uniref:Uncharacterized protein n=1 Tax=Meripilus lineatus TaxID=2056292 RepID=A0AAD5UTP4_9APHY|nr:hypothetical protein NLI96_g11187 [Physisporinus lineatus]
MCRVRGAAEAQAALLRRRSGVASHDTSWTNVASSSVSVDAIRRGARRRRHSASDDLPVFIADAGAHNPSITRHFSRAIDPTRRGAVDKEMRRHQRSNVHQVNRTAKYLRHEGCIFTDINLDHLRSRPHSDKNLAWAEKIECKMTKPNFKLRTTTTLLFGANRQPAVLYLSYHYDAEGNKIRDNIPDRALLAKHINTQKLAHEFPNQIDISSGDQRHEADQSYPLMFYKVAGTDIIRYEHKGVRHDCQYWTEQGHPDRVRPSAALLGRSSAERNRIVQLTHTDWKIQDLVSRYVKRFFPQQFRLLKIAFDRGHWASSDYNEEGYEGGIFFNRVTLWKSTARMHRDRKDYLCAIFCSGAFEGGELVLPDVRMKFKYSPGDIVIFFSDAFYHSILPWAPLLKQPEDIVSPGRVSWVLNTHTDVLNRFLQDDYEELIYRGQGYRQGYQ